MKKAEKGILPITDPKMTRFNITLSEGVDMVLWALKNTQGGELYVPKIPSYKITDVAEAIGPDCKKEIIGIRPGEKIHEEMITASDSFTTIDLGDYFAIMPSNGHLLEKYQKQGIEFKKVREGFAYNSETNKNFLSVEEIRRLIRKNIDKNFMPS